MLCKSERDCFKQYNRKYTRKSIIIERLIKKIGLLDF